MKISSVSLCLAAAAVCVAAQSAPEQETQQSYFAMVLQRDEPQDTVSEFDYRGDILARYNVGGFEAQDLPPLPVPTLPVPTLPVPTLPEVPTVTGGVGTGDPCKDVPNLVGTILPGIDGLADTVLKPLNLPDIILEVLKTGISAIKAVLKPIGLGDLTDIAFGAVHTAISAVITALTPLTLLPGVGTLASKAIEFLNPFMKIFDSVHGCDTSKIAIEMSTCSTLADMYRIGVKTAAQSFPGANDANNEELKNLISASVAILGLMDQTSIASSNDALLSTRPIFSASLLDQYRQELIQKADSDSLKQFAQADLAFLISISNALEACLRVAADPEAAADELAEEYEAMGDDEEYDDEEYDDEE